MKKEFEVMSAEEDYIDKYKVGTLVEPKVSSSLSTGRMFGACVTTTSEQKGLTVSSSLDKGLPVKRNEIDSRKLLGSILRGRHTLEKSSASALYFNEKIFTPGDLLCDLLSIRAPPAPSGKSSTKFSSSAIEAWLCPALILEIARRIGIDAQEVSRWKYPRLIEEFYRHLNHLDETLMPDDRVTMSYISQDSMLIFQLISIIQEVPGAQRVLSVGIGNAPWEIAARQRGHTVIGIDLNSWSLRLVKRPGISLVKADAHYSPFKENIFDTAVFSESIGDMDIEMVLKEAAAALKPEGRIIITTYSTQQVKRIKGAFYIKYPFPMIKEALIKQGFHSIEQRELVSQFVIGLTAIIGIKRNLPKREVVSFGNDNVRKGNPEKNPGEDEKGHYIGFIIPKASSSSIAPPEQFFILPAGKALARAGLASSSAIEKDSVNKLKEAFNNLPWDSRALAYLENSSLKERQNLVDMLEKDNGFIKLISKNDVIKAYGVKKNNTMYMFLLALTENNGKEWADVIIPEKLKEVFFGKGVSNLIYMVRDAITEEDYGCNYGFTLRVGVARAQVVYFLTLGGQWGNMPQGIDYWWLEKKMSGMLCPLFSLREEYDLGIGNLDSLYKFIDYMLLKDFDMWFSLPTTQIASGDPCPYASLSVFAHNDLYLPLNSLIGPEKIQQYLKSAPELARILLAAKDSHKIDYSSVCAVTAHILRSEFINEAYPKIMKGEAGFDDYREENKYWIDDYALFRVLLNYFKGDPWWQWPNEYKNRDIKALKSFANIHQKEIIFYQWLQWGYGVCWQTVRTYAKQKGNRIIGDLPIYPAHEDEMVSWGRKILISLAEAALGDGIVLIGEDIGERPPKVRKMLDGLSEQLPNLFLYNVAGWREKEMARQSHTLICEAVFDSPSTFITRWPELSGSDKEQVKGFLSDHGYAIQEGESPEAISIKVIAAMKKCENLFYSLTLQTVEGWVENSRINIPGTVGPHNWTWRMPVTIESLIERENLNPSTEKTSSPVVNGSLRRVVKGSAKKIKKISMGRAAKLVWVKTGKEADIFEIIAKKKEEINKSGLPQVKGLILSVFEKIIKRIANPIFKAESHFEAVEKTIEELKIKLGSAYEGGGRRKKEETGKEPRKDDFTERLEKMAVVRGRDIETGLPKSLRITEIEVREALAPTIARIIEGIVDVLEESPPELTSDILEHGILLTGGGSLLYGLDSLIVERTHIPVIRAEDPLTTVVRGTGKVLEDEALLDRVKVIGGLK